jgi:PAS domain S-box-containing protein
MNNREKADDLVPSGVKKTKHSEAHVKSDIEKTKLTEELFVANEEKVEREAELVIANEEKAELEAELVIANKEKAEREAELIIANEEKAKREAELVIANEEKAKRAAELVIAKKDKAKRAAELVIANAEKAKRAAELVIANAEKAKRAAVLIIANLKKEKLAEKLIIADKELVYQNEEKIKRAAELFIADVIKTKLEAELVIANIEKTKRLAKSIIADKELSFQTEEKSKRAAELVIADAEKAKREAELVIANIKKAKRSAELVIANVEKAKRAAELVIANKELVFQKSEKSKRAAELIIANVEKAKRAAELVIANIEKAKRAAEFVVANQELVLAKEKEKLTEELIILNKELTCQIEKRIQSDQALKESNEKYSEAFKSSPYSLSITSVKEGKFIEVNDAFTMIFGFTREEAITNSSIRLDIWENIEDRKWVISTLLDGRIVSGKEFLFKKKDGKIITCLFASRIININKESFILSSIDDITNRKHTEFELIKAKEKAEESDRLKSIFLTNMSHEIRTPMNGILGFTELLKEPKLSSDEQQDYIKTIQMSGTRLLDTINSIVDISKIESGLIQVNIKETNINDQIEFIYKFFKPEAEIKGLQLLLKNSLPSNEAIIKTDNEKVYAILTNLVKNAIKFTFKGSIEFGYAKKGEFLEFFVKDTGVGIPKNQKETIFIRFRQGSESYNRGYEGSGLGLSIAKSFVEMLGGKIWVESQEGKGSTFYFTIPYNTLPEEKTQIENVTIEIDKEVPLKNLKILIAEDDEISFSFLSKTLQNISCEILHAITGVEAVDACRNNPGLDLVLMDIRMPLMNGIEATRQIRQFNKDVIIIAQTAYAFAGDSEIVLAPGFNDYISKPINQLLLKELIYKYFNN